MQQSSLNKHRRLPGIKSPPADDNKATSIEPTQTNADGDKPTSTDDIAKSESTAVAAAEVIKPQNYKLKDLPLDEVISEVEIRMSRLKTCVTFSNSDCSDDLRYLSASTRCGSSPEVNCVHDSYKSIIALIRCHL